MKFRQSTQLANVLDYTRCTKLKSVNCMRLYLALKIISLVYLITGMFSKLIKLEFNFINMEINLITLK